jgi:hypothetical protein
MHMHMCTCTHIAVYYLYGSAAWQSVQAWGGLVRLESCACFLLGLAAREGAARGRAADVRNNVYVYKFNIYNYI